MKKVFLLFLIVFASRFCSAQIPTFSENVASIIFNNCTGCHRPGNIAPFLLTNYDEVSGAAYSIIDAINNKIMPPWPPDSDYRHFVNERVLSNSEIQVINDWISFGMPEGDTSLLPPLPLFNEGSEIGNPDVQYNLPHYTLGYSVDEYRCFVIPSQFTQDVFIKAFEFIPGNKLIDHHAVIFWDTTGICNQLDMQSTEPGYSSYSSFAGTVYAPKIAIWVPGSPPLVLPEKLGYRIPANADLIVQVHYPAGSVGLVDSSKLNIFYQSGFKIRNVSLKTTINVDDITNGPLIIPADSIKTFYAQAAFPVKTSLIAVMPHMHLLGKSTKTFAVQPSGDTIKLVSVPDWNFHWQGTYLYEKLMVMEENAMVYSEFTYDNTSGNLLNPNNPPETVYSGNSTENEMLLNAFLSVVYKPGDENIFLNSTDDTSTEFLDEFLIYPNPSNGNFVFRSDLKSNQTISLSILNIQGVIVKKIASKTEFSQGLDFQIFDVSDLPSGIYLLKVCTDKAIETKRLLIAK